jgi:hypothetical protein
LTALFIYKALKVQAGLKTSLHDGVPGGKGAVQGQSWKAQGI